MAQVDSRIVNRGEDQEEKSGQPCVFPFRYKVRHLEDNTDVRGWRNNPVPPGRM